MLITEELKKEHQLKKALKERKKLQTQLYQALEKLIELRDFQIRILQLKHD